MPVITLTTDWGNQDFYVAAVKGCIFSICPQTTVIDISHQIKTFNIAQAAFVIKSAYKFYPDESVHIIGVFSEQKEDQPYICVKYHNQFFVGTDNGCLGLIIDDLAETVIKLDESEKYQIADSTFPELSVFATAAAHLANGVDINNLGKKIKDFRRSVSLMPAIDESRISGHVIYVDSFKNLITDISKNIFERVGKLRPYTIYVQSHNTKNRIDYISKSYNESIGGELLALFNSLDLLEIAQYEGFVSDHLKLGVGAAVIINFANR